MALPAHRWRTSLSLSRGSHTDFSSPSERDGLGEVTVEEESSAPTSATVGLLWAELWRNPKPFLLSSRHHAQVDTVDR